MKTPAGQDANATRVQPAEAGGSDPFGLAPWLRTMPDVPLHPLMAHPVAAMAATTAIGLGIAGQMAGAMLGLMQSAAERAKVALDEAAEAKAQPQPVEPVKAKPVLTVVPKAEKPAVAKTVTVAREKSATPKTAEARPVRKAPAARTAKADDLKAISGIGPKLEQVLNGMGFRRYADIAGLKPADVARIEAELGFAGRIARDGWVEQARALAKGRG
ncbi:NADH:ubiquinone oxidoreductase [Shinella granuli]|uniref:NADH-quinone oxidoreductase subunit E n=1 Tax=Shinella granuli TaxID=323621 RepID=A0A4R2D0R9_SHIGR|nr:NADH:ubiquinone oxidoreductase [Shinella granuli]TCN47918.1 NADH-quinone oxidoreductase subunit E [Shinella granuli]